MPETYPLVMHYYYAHPGRGVGAVRHTTYLKSWAEVYGFLNDHHWDNYYFEVWEYPTTLSHPLLVGEQAPFDWEQAKLDFGGEG